MLTATRLTRADVAQRVAESFVASGGGDGIGSVGVEVEWIPIIAAGDLAPAFVTLTSGLLATDSVLFAEARISFEPGGQVEMSPPPAPSISGLLDGVEDLTRRVRARLDSGGVELLSAGTDPLHTTDEIGLQTPGPRYSAMQAHFDGIGPAGRRMMRQTAALQVCLDLGGPGVALDRWRLANLAGPALSAAFANSPILERHATGTPGTRSLIWQQVDAGRTGFDGAHVGKDRDATAAYTEFALQAVRIPPARGDGANRPPSLTLAQLLDEPDGVMVDAGDLTHHLSTLFPPVRPRGHLEVRYVDSLPERWLPVPVAVLAALLYDREALGEALDVVRDDPADASAWTRSATFAMREPSLRVVAHALFDIALRSMSRLPDAYVGRATTGRVTEYRERFIEEHRTPADDQLDAFRRDPEALSTWR